MMLGFYILQYVIISDLQLLHTVWMDTCCVRLVDGNCKSLEWSWMQIYDLYYNSPKMATGFVIILV